MRLPTLVIVALSAGAAHAQVEWARVNLLQGRALAACAYDTARGQLLLFGGLLGGTLTDETWAYDGYEWTLQAPTRRPSARSGSALAFDEFRGRIVLFGGNETDETWEWDGSDWTKMTVASRPPGRSRCSLTWDPNRRRCVLFGGYGQGGYFDDLWEWDGTAWTQRTPGLRPVGRYAHAAAFDLQRKKLVVQGGYALGGYHTDTWEWDGAGWTRILASGGPSIRAAAFCEYDRTLGRVLLFGGDVLSNVTSDLWTFDGVAWTKIVPAHLPSPRAAMVGAWNPTSARLLMFGGLSSASTAVAGLTDTWEWDSRDWTLRRQLAQPSPRVAAAVCYDESRRRSIVFGGGVPGTSYGDTWLFDGVAWELRKPAVSPPPRLAAAMAFDAARGKAVLFGGFDNVVESSETWLWDGTTWSKANPPVAPRARLFHSMTWDSTRRRVVLFGGAQGGNLLDDLWEWDGAKWTQATPTSAIPPARYQHGLAYDPMRGATLLFGGVDTTSSALNDTWQWDGDRWTKLTPVHAPNPRSWIALATDAARGRCVLYGGTDPASSFLVDTWEWDGLQGDWLQRPTQQVLGDRCGYGVAFDSARSRMLLFGGLHNGLSTNEAYELGPTSPGLFIQFGSGCSGSNGLVGMRAVPGFYPFLGGTLAIELTNFKPGGQTILALGLSRTSTGGLGLPMGLSGLGMPGCTLYVSTDLQLSLTGTSVSFVVPTATSLLGKSLYMQTITSDPPANTLGAVMSDAYEARFGAK